MPAGDFKRLRLLAVSPAMVVYMLGIAPVFVTWNGFGVFEECLLNGPPVVLFYSIWA